MHEACCLPDPNLPTADESGEDQELANIKLRRYLERNPYKAKGIASALYCIGDALSDKKKLLDACGIEVDLDDVQIPIERTHTGLSPSAWNNLKTDVIQKTKTVRSRFTTTRKLTWVLKDNAKFNVLIETLKKHNDSLHLLCPEFAFELLLINVALDYLPRHKGSDLKQLQQLLSSSEVKPLSTASESVRGGGEANTEAATEAGAAAAGKEIGEIFPVVSPSQQGLQVVADLANIKIEAASSSMEEELSLEKERELLCLLLRLPVCAKRLHTLELLGLVEFPKQREFYFVYRLPYSLDQHKSGFPIEDTRIRKPRTTLQHWKHDPTPALGLRFDMARKLVQRVSFLHASGWFHKNIRTDELYILPKSGPELSREWDGMDFKNPFLLGYLYSRPDDVQPPLPSRTRRPVVSEVPTSIQSQEGQASLEQSSQDREIPPASMTKEQQIEQQIEERRVRFAQEDSSDSSSYDTNHPNPRRHTQEAHRVNLDMKHHPSKRAFPERRYCHAFDVYSLGIALLEIGLWTPVEVLYSDRRGDIDPFDTRRKLIGIALELLERCGERYTKVTISCLSVDPEDSEESLIEQRELCARTAADLAQCQV
ncbi:hypothetical protein V501_09687 [Pseudogymnoascus sp. VKM F-4519 (FW-2642)]|nr:hypothetical protein V501_09687 [Pseudogymnoascus sp. VKM F-4519 (FW-2642)]